MSRGKGWRDAVVLVCGRGLEAIGQVVAIRALTTFLSPYEAGRYYLLLGVVSWIGLGVVNPVWTFCGRKLIEWAEEGSASHRIAAFTRFVLVVALIGSVLVIAARQTIGLGFEVSIPWLASIALGLLLCGQMASAFIAALNILGRRIPYVVFKNLILWGGAGLSALGAVVIAGRSELWIGGQIAMSAIVAAAAGILLLRNLRNTGRSDVTAQAKRPKLASTTAVFHFAWPLSIAVCLYWIQTQGYRFVLAGVGGEASVGMFVAGYSIGAALLVAFEALTTEFYQPIFYRALVAQDTPGRVAAWNEYAAWYLPSIALMAVYVAASGPFLLRLIAGERFQGLGGVVAWAAVTESVRLVSSAFYMAAVAELDMRQLIVPGILGAASALVGVGILSPLSEFHGTGFALFLAASSVMLAMGFGLRRWLAIAIPWTRLGKAVAIATPVMVVLPVAAHSLPHPTSTQALTILIAGGCYTMISQLWLGRRMLFA